MLSMCFSMSHKDMDALKSDITFVLSLFLKYEWSCEIKVRIAFIHIWKYFHFDLLGFNFKLLCF